MPPCSHRFFRYGNRRIDSSGITERQCPRTKCNPLGDENDDDDGRDDEVSHESVISSMPAFLRLLHQLLAIYEDFSVVKFVSSKQSELESLSSPLTLELRLSEDGAELLQSLIAEPTVSVSNN